MFSPSIIIRLSNRREERKKKGMGKKEKEGEIGKEWESAQLCYYSITLETSVFQLTDKMYNCSVSFHVYCAVTAKLIV